MTPLLLAALAALAAGQPPLVESPHFSADAQWAALAATARVVSTGTAAAGNTQRNASGVAVAAKDGYLYVLTALHAVPAGQKKDVQFFTKESYPQAALTLRDAVAVVQLPDPDVALLRVLVGTDVPPTLKIAGPGQRPKAFPAPVLAVGMGRDDAPTCLADQVLAKRFVRWTKANEAFFWETGIPPTPGRSGGPLVDTAGRVIGLCSAQTAAHGYYAHLDEILAGLKKNGHGWVWQ